MDEIKYKWPPEDDRIGGWVEITAKPSSHYVSVVVTTTWYTENGPEVENVISGDIKWDGCANLTIGPPQDTAMHLCDIRRLSRLIEHLRHMCATEWMPDNWDLDDNENPYG